MESWIFLILITSWHTVTASVYACNFNQQCVEDFESKSENEKLKWKTVSNADGDNRDSETGGSVMKLESKKKTAEKGEFSGLTHKIVLTSPEQCVEFFYRMKASDSQCTGGRLKVLVKCGDGEKEVYRSYRPGYNKWKQAVFNVKGNTGDNCIITVDAGRGISEDTNNYIWLDDFIVHNQACTKTSSTPYSLTTSFANGDKGSWVFPLYSWIVGKGNSEGFIDSKVSGIKQSATRSHDYYLYTKPSVANSVATLKSIKLYFDAETCLRFFAWRGGEKAPELTVKVNSDTKFKNAGVPEFRMAWQDVAITLPANNDFVVEINANTKEVSNDDFGIDNVFVQDGACATDYVYKCQFDTDCDDQLTKEGNHATYTKVDQQLRLKLNDNKWGTTMNTYVNAKAVERSARGWCLTFGVRIGADATKCKIQVQHKYKRGTDTKEHWGRNFFDKEMTNKEVITVKLPIIHLLKQHDRRLNKIIFKTYLRNENCKEVYYDFIKLSKGLCEMENMF